MIFIQITLTTNPQPQTTSLVTNQKQKTKKAGEDSWAWVGFVLVDMYLFVLLAHASIIWMPRPMASQEYVKYAPLEVSASLSNDLELWVSYQFVCLCRCYF